MIDYICDTIDKYDFKGYKSIYDPNHKRITNIQKWIELDESISVVDAELELRDIVKDICENVYSMDSDGLTTIFRNVAIFNIIQDM